MVEEVCRTVMPAWLNQSNRLPSSLAAHRICPLFLIHSLARKLARTSPPMPKTLLPIRCEK